MADKTLQAYALARVAKVLGGDEPLARRLGISQPKLKLYLEDLDTLPQALFLKIVDVLVDDQITKIAGDKSISGYKRQNG